MFRHTLLRGVSATALLYIASTAAFAQQTLPQIDIGTQQAGQPRQPVAGAPARGPARAAGPVVAQPAAPQGGGSLTVPPVAEQRREVLSNVGSVAFVDRNSPGLRTRYVHDLRDALKDVPGVFVQSRYGQELRLSVRGSNITRDYHLRGLELLQDGIPMNYADGGGDMYQIDPNYFRSIEVLKGGNALAYGSSTLGGAINFVSPTAHTALAPNMLTIEGGSYGTVRGSAQMSRVMGDFDFLINGNFTHADGFRKHSQTDYTQINANLGYRFNNDIETRFYFAYSGTWQKLPGQLTLGDALTNPRQSLAPFPAGFGVDAWQGDQARNVRNFRISNKTTINSEIGRIDINSWYISNYLYHPIFVVIQQQGETWGFAPKLTKTFDIAGHPNDLVVGGRVWGGTSSDNWYTNFNGMTVNPYGPLGGGAAFPPFSWNGLAQFGLVNSCGGFCGPLIDPGADPRLRHNVASSLNLEAYFEDRFHIAPELTLMFGAKLFGNSRRYTVRGDIPFEPTPNSTEVVYRGIVPKVGVMYEPRPDLQFFANMTGSRDVPDFIDLTQGYFPPQRTGLTFTPLVQQKAWTGEIGSRGKWDRFAWDVTFYHSELQDELLKFFQGVGVTDRTLNAKRTMHQGVELAGSVDLWRGLLGPNVDDLLKLSQVWTWNDFRFVNDVNFGNNQMAGIPRHVLRTVLSYSHPTGAYLSPQIDWVPEGAYADYAHTLQTPGYVLFGLQAGLKLPHGASVYLEARNLSNRHYISDISTVSYAGATNPRVFYPGVGRTIYGGVRWEF